MDGIDYSQGLNCLRGAWDDTASAMILTLEEWAGKGVKVVFDVKNLSKDCWIAYERHGRVLHSRVVEGMGVHVEADIGPGEEVDFCYYQRGFLLLVGRDCRYRWRWDLQRTFHEKSYCITGYVTVHGLSRREYLLEPTYTQNGSAISMIILSYVKFPHCQVSFKGPVRGQY